MRVLGLDPGATTGWCLYVDSDAGRYVQACGTFSGHLVTTAEMRAWLEQWRPDFVAIERPKGYGPTRPQLVDCGYVCGRLVGEMRHLLAHVEVKEMTRLEVCQTLTAAVHGVVNVRTDATAWAALVLLHGEGSDRKPKTRKGEVIDDGGPLGRVTSHARAALAVAVAWTLRAQEVPA